MTFTLTYNPLVTTIAEWIKNLRIHLDLTQAQMAQRVNVSKVAYQNWEYGKHRPTGPAMTLLAMLAEQAGHDPPPDTLSTIYGPRKREEQ